MNIAASRTSISHHWRWPLPRQGTGTESTPPTLSPSSSSAASSETSSASSPTSTHTTSSPISTLTPGPSTPPPISATDVTTTTTEITTTPTTTTTTTSSTPTTPTFAPLTTTDEPSTELSSFSELSSTQPEPTIATTTALPSTATFASIPTSSSLPISVHLTPKSTLTITSEQGGLQTGGAAAKGGSSNVNVSALVGGVIGGTTLIGVLVALCLFLKYRKRKQRYLAVQTEPKPWTPIKDDIDAFEPPTLHPYYNAFAHFPSGEPTLDLASGDKCPCSTTTALAQCRPKMAMQTNSQTSDLSNNSGLTSFSPRSSRALLAKNGQPTAESSSDIAAAAVTGEAPHGESGPKVATDTAGCHSPSAAYPWGASNPTKSQKHQRRLIPTNPDPVGAASATPDDKHHTDKMREVAGGGPSNEEDGKGTQGTAELSHKINTYVDCNDPGTTLHTPDRSAPGEVPPLYDPQWGVERRRWEPEGSRYLDLKQDLKQDLGS